MRKFKDKTGERHGLLIVLKYLRRDHYKGIIYYCKCDCGNEKEISAVQLRENGGTRSCGCMKRKLDIEKAKKISRWHKNVEL